MNIENKILLKEKLVEMLEENEKLKRRTIELETYVIETDILPESSTENLTKGTSDHENTIFDDMKIFENSKEEKLCRNLPIKINYIFKTGIKSLLPISKFVLDQKFQ